MRARDEAEACAIDEAGATRAPAARDADAIAAADGPLLLESAQRALQQSEALLRAVFDGAHDAMLIADDTGRYVDANGSACALFGLPHDELIGKHPRDFTAAPAALVDAAWAGFLEAGSGAGEFALLRPDGEIRILDYRATAHILPGRHLSVLRDVTSQRRAEEALRRSDERFSRVFQASPAPMVVSRVADWRVVEANDAFLAIMGKTREETLGLCFEDFGMRPEPGFAERLRQRRESGGTWSNEPVTFGTPGAGEVRVLLSQEAIELDGEPCVLTIGVDVTEREHALQGRREVEERLRAVVSSAPVVLFAVDAQCRFTVVEGNASQTPLVGQSALELFGDLSLTLQGGATLSARDAFERVLAGEALRVEARVGSRWYDIRLDPLAPRRGVVGVATDVTDRHAAEQKLRTTHEMLRALVLASPAAIVVIRCDKTVELWNPAAEAILGYRMEEMLGKPVPRALAPVLTCETGPCDGTTMDMQRTFVRPDGSTVELSVSKARLLARDGTPRGCVAILVDVTQHRTTEALLVRAQKMDVVGRLAGGVAHDFNNMLAAISGFANLALWQLEPDSQVASDLNEIVAAVERARTLTGRLLLFGRHAPVEPRPVDLNGLVRDFDKVMRRLITEEIELLTECSPTLWPALVDPGHMEQLILNLVINARDAMARGGVVSIRTCNVAGHGRDGDRVALTVTDTGTGMSEEVAARIFEPFFTTKEEGRGTGLGLPIVHNIVARHGGEVQVDTALGQGTRFTVLLPRAPVEPESPEQRRQRGGVKGGTETVLVVDDNDLVLRTTEQVLARHGYTVILARSGPEALERFEQGGARIRLLLTDVVMPQMRGTELAARLRERDPRLPVLFMSGYAEGETDNAEMLANGQTILFKPFDPDRLLAVVRRMLDKPV